MEKGVLSRNKVLILNLSFWVLYLTYRFYDLQKYLGYQKTLTYLSVPLVFNLIACYVHYFFILPDWFRNKKLGRYFFKLFLLLVPVIAARIVAENHILILITTNEEYYKTLSLARLISTVWDTMTFLIFIGMIRFTLEWFEFESRQKALENEKLVAELNYLKAQINPHFLFNTLHNLNYLVYSGSTRATDVIIRLSNIMRYMIYDANKQTVPLKKEIDYIHDYIHLESIRLNQKFTLSFDCQGNHEHVEIAPLVMLTFLENAFKHGVSDQEPDCRIDVKIDVKETSIYFEVTNRKIKNPGNKSLRSGFGLNNVMKRLQLSYPQKHTLDIRDENEFYKVSLTLSRL